MRFYLPKPLRPLLNFGRVRYTGADFLKLVEACGIDLVLSSQIDTGYYYYSAKIKQHVIVVSSKISRAEREQIGWHEFGHFLQNYWKPLPMRADFCQPGDRTPPEHFADLFAFVCVTGVAMCGRIDFLETLMTMRDKPDDHK